MNTQQITAEYLDHMGTDLSVVNAARASFGKESEWDWRHDINEAGDPFQVRALKPADAKLIRFLATGYRTKEWDNFLTEIIEEVMASYFAFENPTACKENLTRMLQKYKRQAKHWAPFAHPQVSIRMRLPIFLARQFVKHQQGAVWSEESRRYISEEPGVWFPSEWHTRPEDIKQGAAGLHGDQELIASESAYATRGAIATYMGWVKEGVAPEEARTVLPLNTMTTVVWTGSLLFWSRVFDQRADSHAQLAAQELAHLIGDIVEPLFPVSWDALTS